VCSKCASSEQWTLAIDRGGLWHIKQTTFSLFIAIEEEVRECLKMLLGSTPIARRKEEIVKRVISSDDVHFYWLIATADFEINKKEVTRPPNRNTTERNSTTVCDSLWIFFCKILG